MAESERRTDLVDRLVCKYMRKCKVKVESSTDSESDNEIMGPGVTTSTQNHSSSWRKRSSKLQFIDPYDGDSEEASTQSDSSTCSQRHREQGNWSRVNKMGKNATQDTLSLPYHKPMTADLMTVQFTSHDVSMKSLTNNAKTPFQMVSKPPGGSSAAAFQDMSMDTGATTSVSRHSNSGHFLLIGLDSRTVHHCGSGPSPKLPDTRTSEESSEFHTLPISAEKRKLGLKADYLNDKFRRKKARVTESIQLPPVRSYQLL